MADTTEEYLKPARRNGENGNIYATRLLVSYSTWLYAHYSKMNVQSKYLEHFAFLHGMITMQPQKLELLYLQLAKYIQDGCRHLITRDITRGFVVSSINEGVNNQADREKIDPAHIDRFTNMFWILVKTINNIK